MIINSTNSFTIEPTKVTPYISYDAESALFEIKGISSPHDTPAFYAPILAFLDNLRSFQISQLTIRISLVYFNSSSAKALYMVLKKVKAAQREIDFTIEWICDEEDEDMIESVEDYRDILDLDIELIIDELNEEQ